MGIKDLEPFQFTSENQPDPEKKKVPKLKTRMRKLVEENFDKYKEMIESKYWPAWKEAIDRGYGKTTDNIKITNENNLTDDEIDKLIEAKLRLIQDKTNSNS
jgi:hypothetical protein